jgi:hypothetical protein
MSNETVMILLKHLGGCILLVFYFMNYLYFSKHLHILLAFPNTYFADLNPQGQFDNLEAVTKEVKMMMDYAFAATPPLAEG